MKNVYDVAIIGAGPAGVTAGIYASNFGLRAVIIEKNEVGGQLLQTDEIVNYPGFEKISGKDLAQKFKNQLNLQGVEFLSEKVVDSELGEDVKKLQTENETILAKTVIITSGNMVRTLNLDREKQFAGKGVFYSALSQKQNVEGQNVAVIGGGNAALEDALMLSDVANKVYIIHRRNEFRADNIFVEKAKAKSNIELLTPYVPQMLIGEGKLSALELLNVELQKTKQIDVSSVFVCVGRDSSNDFVDSKVNKNEQGYIMSNENMQTNVAGVFVAGDARCAIYRQIVCATSDGAIASLSAFNYLKNNKSNKKK